MPDVAGDAERMARLAEGHNGNYASPLSQPSAIEGFIPRQKAGAHTQAPETNASGALKAKNPSEPTEQTLSRAPGQKRVTFDLDESQNRDDGVAMPAETSSRGQPPSDPDHSSHEGYRAPEPSSRDQSQQLPTGSGAQIQGSTNVQPESGLSSRGPHQPAVLVLDIEDPDSVLDAEVLS